MTRRTLSVCAVVLVLGGCAPGNAGLIVAAALAPSESCTIESSNAQLPRGVMDVMSSTASYAMHPLYFNQLLNLSSTGAPPRADPNVMWVQRAEVELRDVQGATIAGPYSVPATGYVPSVEGDTAGQGVGAIEIIPLSVALGLRDSVPTGEFVQVLAVVRAVGVTAGGAEVISPPFNYPILLCAYCLFQCLTDTESGIPICVRSCIPGQDAVTTTPGACDLVIDGPDRQDVDWGCSSAG